MLALLTPWSRSRRAVFRHFPTKQDLIEATAARYLEKLTEQTRRPADGADPGKAFAMLLRALAHVSSPDKSETLDRAVGIILDGLAVPR
jgi:AcrR family transcriptional regulator